MSDKSDNNDSILVHVSDTAAVRGSAPKQLKVEVLAENVNLFLTQMENIVAKAPDKVGKFRFSEFVVSAEISANGKLVLLGSGIEAATKGSLTFKFTKDG